MIFFSPENAWLLKRFLKLSFIPKKTLLKAMLQNLDLFKLLVYNIDQV